MNGLLPGVYEMVFRVSVPLNALQEPWLLSPSHSLQTPPVIQHTSVFWIEREGNGPLWQHPAQWGELRTHSHAPTSPEGYIVGWAGFSWHLNCAALGEKWRVKWNHSSYSSVHRVLDNLLLLFHWCLELLRWFTGFHKDALIHGRLSKLMFFGGRVVEHSYLPFWWHCLTRLNIILFANINVI